MPKCVVVDPGFDWKGEASRNAMPWDRTILYEVHVKGFTKHHPAVEERLRGTYAGLGAGPVLEYIRSLGVTSVELLPIHTFVNDSTCDSLQWRPRLQFARRRGLHARASPRRQ